MPIKRLFLVGVLCVGSYATAQISTCLPIPHILPEDLRSSLEERFSTFLAAQAEEHWDEVAALLGRCRFGCADGNFFYTSSYKQCLVLRMQEVRILDFDFSIHDPFTCSTKMELPTGAVVPRVAAEQLSWYLRGTAKFQTSSEEWLEQTQVTAYRDRGQWYFIPPQRNMQDKWEKAHYTDADFVRDRQEEIEIRNSRQSPIEITDVHVYMDRQYPSLRNIDFKLRNKTSKKVIGLWMRIGDESGAVDFSGPYQIKPKGYLTHEESVAAYSDFCEGIRKHPMVIEEVSFADGSKWESKRPSDQKASDQGD
ncbi:MAG: hypothetical protein JWQ49_2512 [Edaphobacter sp.]|nr:hypothetical protein [Edaphobacter sp.]